MVVGAFGQPRLEGVRIATNGWIQVQGVGASNRIVNLEASTNLVQWGRIALLDGRVRSEITGETLATNDLVRFWDVAAGDFPWRFYRASVAPIQSTNDWKNQAYFPNDAFASIPLGEGDAAGIRWLKFAILLKEPGAVFYQDSEKYLLHHDFAAARLAPFKGMGRAEFDQVSLFTNAQQVLLGSLMFPPDTQRGEYAIQFAGRDPYPRETLSRFFELVRSTVVADPGVIPFYFPAYEQSQTAALDESYFAARGIRVSSVQRWIRGDQVYAAGWALGRVTFIPADQIAAAYLEGRLRPQDILVTDGIPAEVPFVAGIISFAPATPNSHVAILAGSFGVPFVYVADLGSQARIRQLLGREAVLQGVLRDGFGEVQVFAVDGNLDANLRAELLALKTPAPVQIVPKAVYGAFSAPVEKLTPSDIRFFGGKAAHFGLLRRVVPSNSPPAIAFSFDLWDAFMEQPLSSGKSMRSEISARLSRYVYPPPMAELGEDLSVIRHWITREAQFSAEQRQAVIAALAGFDRREKIRFRSSSNAEDAETFTAAGLYDSFSGCLADDLDDDASGPCQCDSSETEERGVFRAIQKVYASFYNDNAFRERLRRGLNESQVGMGLLVHYSTPDEKELANGVATVSSELASFGQRQLTGVLVSQAGAVSVTNPDGLAKPEVVDATEFGLTLREPSGLVPWGSHVLDWPTEYDTLKEMLFQVYQQYQGIAGAGKILDFEYKKVAPGHLLLKQVRPLSPAAKATPSYLLNEPTTYWIYQSEGSDVLANHRLKCFLTLQNRSVRRELTNLQESFYTEGQFEFQIGSMTSVLSGPLRSWPNAAHSVTNDARLGLIVRDRWTVGENLDQRRFELTSILPTATSDASPFVRQGEIRKWLSVTYATPVPALDWDGNGMVTTNEEVQLVTSPELTALEAGAPETFAVGALRFTVQFLSSTNALGPPLGIDKNFWGTYPAALSPWMHTQITGLTTEPLELKGYWSQSARAGHKFRYAWYVFEPRLEPGLPAGQLEELRAANIQLLHIERETWPGGQATVHVLGNDGQFRKWAPR